jgi:adenosylcobyric acid synthase
MNRARTIMVQGTASSVGKSILTTALCRMFARRGLSVAPFKSQNMALNAAVTPDGGEIGRAQYVQAMAAGVAPTVDMNPILLKPEGDARSQVVVLGKPIGSMGAVEYHHRKPELRGIVTDALERLRARHDVIVIEGAGSPAEINLKSRDLVNMFVATAADAPVLLVGDIDKGGVFAALIGTVDLLPADERARIAGFVINKFRGDIALLTSGLDELTLRTGIPVLGVVPHLPRLRIADEDSVSLDHRPRHRPTGAAADGVLDIAVVRLPRISNYDDVHPLEHEPGVAVRFAESPDGLLDADLVIVPGSKSTVSDLDWLRASGIADAVVERARRGRPVLGICGGYQMMGDAILDPEAIESDVPRVLGLGLLPVTTHFGAGKVTAQIEASIAAPCLLGAAGDPVAGYMIHMGRVTPTSAAAPPLTLRRRNGEPVDAAQAHEGAVGYGGAVVGTTLHGLFDGPGVRAAVLADLRRRRGLPAPAPAASPDAPRTVDDFDRLADAVEAALDRDRLDRIVGLRT